MKLSDYLWRTPHVLFHFARVGCFSPWCRSWSHSRKQPPIKRSKPNWWSQQSWLGKVFELRWCFQKRLNVDMANKQASLIYNCSSANKKNSMCCTIFRKTRSYRQVEHLGEVKHQTKMYFCLSLITLVFVEITFILGKSQHRVISFDWPNTNWRHKPLTDERW